MGQGTAARHLEFKSDYFCHLITAAVHGIPK